MTGDTPTMPEQLETLGRLRPELAEVTTMLRDMYLALEAQRPRHDMTFVDAYPPGHFHSPLPTREEVASVRHRAFTVPEGPEPIGGVDLRERAQLKLYASLVPYYADMPFTEAPTPGLRYHFGNDFFAHTDAFVLYAMLRHFKPKRVVEAGSGFSSCVMLDTDERFLGGTTRFTFIEPYPERLLSNIRPEDRSRCAIIPDMAQNVPLETYASLETGDVLFIDSSHVAKIGSDVLHFVFEVFPALQPGVIIHIHDIFHPFEYPQSWYALGRAWNEAYLVRAFLQYNTAFEVLLFNSFLTGRHGAMFEKHTPVCLRNTGGSLWLRKTR